MHARPTLGNVNMHGPNISKYVHMYDKILPCVCSACEIPIDHRLVGGCASWLHENLDVLGLAILPVCPSYLTPHTNVVSKAKGIVSEVADDILAHNFILNYKKNMSLFICLYVCFWWRWILVHVVSVCERLSGCLPHNRTRARWCREPFSTANIK